MAFDRDKAKAAGYSDAEIDAYLAKTTLTEIIPGSAGPVRKDIAGFDREGAKAAGYSDAEIDAHMEQKAKEKRIAAGRELGAQIASDAAVTDPNEYGPAQIGVGKWADNLVSGAKNLYYAATGDDEAAAKLAKERSENEDRYQGLREAAPKRTLAGEIAPNLLPVPGGLAANAAMGVATSGLAYQKDPKDQLKAAGITGAVIGAPRALRQAGRLLPKAAGVDRALNAGMELTPGQRMGNHSLQQIDASLASIPFVGAPISRMAHRNESRLNESVLDAIGSPHAGRNALNKIDDTTLGEAATRIGNQIEHSTQRITARPTLSFHRNMSNIAAQAENDIVPTAAHVPHLENLQRSMADNNGVLTGQNYQRIRSQMTAEIRAAYRGDKPNVTTATTLEKMVDELDNLAESSITNRRDLAALREARQQWFHLKALEKTKGTIKAGGSVSASSLAATLRSMDKGGFLRGRRNDELYERVRAMDKFRPVVGDSGTATRMTVPVAAQLARGGVGALGAMTTVVPAATYLYANAPRLLRSADVGRGADYSKRALAEMLRNYTAGDK